MKSLKKIIALIIVAFLTAMLVLWTLTTLVKPDLVKGYINSHFSELSHQKTRVEGDISWQIFPKLGIKVTKICIGDEANLSSYSAKLENLHFNVKITPLLRGKLVFNELKVDDFEINVNPQAPSVATKIVDNLEANPESKSNVTEQFAIERFLLSRGHIKIVDSNQVITLSGLQIGGEQFNLQGNSFPFQLKSNIEVNKDNQKILKGYVNFKGSTGLKPAIFSNPLSVLQNTPIDGSLTMQNIKYLQFKIAKISAHTKTKTGVLFLNPLTFNLYNGESVGDLNYEFASKKLTVNQTATNIESSKFIKDLLHKTLFRGSLDLSIHAQANLDSANWQDSIRGSGSFTIKNGLIEAINLHKVIEDTSNQINSLFAILPIKKEQSPSLGVFNNPDFFKGGTNFKLLTFQYQLKDAKLQSNSLVLQTEKLQLKGEGSLNLKDENIDAILFAKVNDLDSGMGKVQQLLGGSFPIEISGQLSKPNVNPDIERINPILTKVWLQETLTKPVKKIGTTIQSILNNSQQLL